MNVNNIGLMPCPFCGEKENIILLRERTLLSDLVEEATDDRYALESFDERIEDNCYGYRVQCKSCFTLGRWGGAEDRAIEHWNVRVSTLKSIVFKHSGKEVITDNMIDVNKG